MKILNATKNFAVIAVLSGMGLSAETPMGFSAGIVLTDNLNSLKEVTNSTSGYGIDGGFTGHLAATDVPFRATFSITSFPGSSENGLKQSLLNYQLAGDVLINTGLSNAYLITGFSVNRWKVKSEGGGLSQTDNVKGLKLGARLGLGYVFMPHLSADLMVQQTELGIDANGLNPINPAWVQVSIHYHF